MIRLYLLFSMLVLATGCNLASAPPQPTPSPVPPQVDLSCDALVKQALTTVGPACDSTSRNEACYGNRLVDADFRGDAVGEFASVGDRALLQTLQQISTAPLDEIQQTWGVALVRAQANLPEALPGQNVTFLLYGGAALDNVTAQMEAVILKTGFGNITCADAPDSAILMQSPGGTQVAMNINGADLILGSTIYVTALADNEMTIATIDGSAQITAFGITRVIVPGSQVRLPLGSTDGLLVIGPPSEPEPFDLEAIQRAPLILLPEQVLIPPPIVPTASITLTPTLPGLPITPTLPPIIIPLPPTAIPQVCIPRADWVYTYVVQPGDTLFSIAQRLGITLAQLQTGNCIVNANLITAGQVLRVPFPPPPPPPTIPPTRLGPGPTLQPTSTTLPIFPTDTPTDPNFRADQTTLVQGDCTNIRWSVQNVSSVLFQGEPAPTSSVVDACPRETTRYTLLVVHPNGDQVPYFLTITVQPPPTEEVILQ